jgi:tRNA(adenine34) deaminase
MPIFAPMIELLSDEWFMGEALKEALKAYDLDEVPVGCVVVSRNRIIARGHNLTERLLDVTAHAEMQAITAAANFLGSKFLEGCRVYITLEPCMMCAGALRWARPEAIIFGAADLKYGFDSTAQGHLHPKTQIQGGVLNEECGKLLSRFFLEKRQGSK